MTTCSISETENGVVKKSLSDAPKLEPNTIQIWRSDPTAHGEHIGEVANDIPSHGCDPLIQLSPTRKAENAFLLQ